MAKCLNIVSENFTIFLTNAGKAESMPEFEFERF